jgi:peptidoglycan biosynthesis protein MviN/MurJ (putative lipid II flippase)
MPDKISSKYFERLQSPAIRATGVHLALRLAGPIRDFALVYAFGATTAIADFYFYVGIQLTLVGVVSSVVTVAFIPYFSRFPVRVRKQTTKRLWVAVGCLCGCPVLIPIFLTHDVASISLLISTVIPMGISSLLSARLLSQSRIIQGLSPGLATSLAPLFALLIPKADVNLLFMSRLYFLGYLVETVFLLVFSSREKTELSQARHPLPKPSDIGWLVSTASLSVIWSTVDLLVIRSFGQDAVVIFLLASRIPLGIASVVLPAINTVLLPRLSRRIRSSDELGIVWRSERNATTKAIIRLSIILCTIGVVSAGITQWFLGSGKITDNQRSEVLLIQIILFGSLIPYIFGTVLGRYLQLGGKMPTVAGVTLFATCLNISLDVLLSRLLGLPGVAVATLLSYASTATCYSALLTQISRRIPSTF